MTELVEQALLPKLGTTSLRGEKGEKKSMASQVFFFFFFEIWGARSA